jgi:hypothetical protein
MSNESKIKIKGITRTKLVNTFSENFVHNFFRAFDGHSLCLPRFRQRYRPHRMTIHLYSHEHKLRYYKYVTHHQIRC